MKPFLILLLTIALLACGGGSPATTLSSGTDEETDEGLFREWTETDSGFLLDLTGGALNSNLAYYFVEEDGSRCDCSLTFLGDETSGSYVLKQCTYRVGSSGGDPGCNSSDHTGTYERDNNRLSICDDTQDCSTYR